MPVEIQPVSLAPGQRARNQHSTWRVACVLFLFLNSIYFLTSSGRVRTPDEYLALFQTESLVLHGTTAVPQALGAGNFYGRYDKTQAPRAPYPPGQALAATPWYVFGHYVLAHLPGVPPDASDLIVPFAVDASSATFAALAATLMFLLFASMRVPLRLALAATGIIAFATPLFAYSSWFFSEPFVCVLILGAAVALFGDFEGWPAVFAGALLLALGFWVRPTHVLAIPVFLLGLLASERRDRWRAASVVAVVAAISFTFLLARNQSMFGSPFDFGYPPMADGRQLNSFSTPIYLGLFGELFSPGKSVFLYAPPVLLAMYRLPILWRKNPGLAMAAGLMLPLYVVFFARLANWEGGYCFGPRYLLLPSLLLCSSLGPLLQERESRIYRATKILFTAGLVVQLIGMATSFLEDQARKGNYYNADWSYRLGYSFAGQVELLWRYSSSLTPAPLGLGFDRWFVFLSKAGVHTVTLVLFAVPAVAVALLSGRKLWAEYKTGDIE